MRSTRFDDVGGSCAPNKRESSETMQSTLLDFGQSRALLIQAIQEGILHSESGHSYMSSQKADKVLSFKSLSQLLTSDNLLVSLDGNTCEFPMEGELINSGQIRFLPYGYDRKEVELDQRLFPTIDLMAELLSRYGERTTSAELVEIVSVFDMLSSEYGIRFGNKSHASVRLGHIIRQHTAGVGTLTDDELSFLSRYEGIAGRMSRINQVIQRFSRQVEISQAENSRLSLDVDHFSPVSILNDEFVCQTGLSSVIGSPGEVQVIRAVCIELGTLPFRTSIKETLKLRDTEQFKELRSFSREFLKVNELLDEASLERLKTEISYAKRHMRFATKAGSVARFFTYIGIPLALATPYIPALGAVGVAATMGGAYATAHQHAREKRFSWANVGIA